MAKSEKHWRIKLTSKQRELVILEAESKEGRDTVELDQTRVGRLSRIDAMQSQAMNNAIGLRRKQELARINAAFSRLDDSEFGYCLKCGDEIPDQRLELDPTALYCIDCNE